MDTTPEQAAEGMELVRVLAAVLERLVGANASLARADPGQITKFHALKAPGIGIQQYLERIHKYASCSNECFILALIYIDRLIQRNNFLLTELNVHRVVITAILLAAKFFDDAYYNNAYYAKVGGVLVSEMNGLEVDFLFRINFSLHVTPELFSKYHAELASHSTGTGLPTPTDLRISSGPNSCQTSPHLQASVGAVMQNHVMAPPQADKLHHVLHHTNHGEHRHPTHITPSPPQSQQPAVPQGYSDENVMISDSFTMLQRHNSGPACTGSVLASGAVPNFPVNQGRCNAPPYNSAPAAMQQIPQSHPQDYHVVDHSAYGVHGGGYHHVAGGNYHQQGQPDGSAPANAQLIAHHYVGGQMLTGVARGF